MRISRPITEDHVPDAQTVLRTQQMVSARERCSLVRPAMPLGLSAMPGSARRCHGGTAWSGQRFGIAVVHGPWFSFSRRSRLAQAHELLAIHTDGAHPLDARLSARCDQLQESIVLAGPSLR